MSFSGIENVDEDLSDDGSQAGEKKRRLSMEQVKTLEKNFELGNKLEPERKMQLARALGLQPRQVAIWFQNRRARWKTKQLEKDYDILKRQFDAIKADNDTLQAQNKKLQSRILALKGREPTESINLNKETEGSCSNRSENSSEINLEISRTPAADSPLSSNPGRPLFPTSIRPTSVIQLLQNSSRTDAHCQKIQNQIQEESICNIFNAIDDHPSFWPWSENQKSALVQIIEGGRIEVHTPRKKEDKEKKKKKTRRDVVISNRGFRGEIEIFARLQRSEKRDFLAVVSSYFTERGGEGVRLRILQQRRRARADVVISSEVDSGMEREMSNLVTREDRRRSRNGQMNVGEVAAREPGRQQRESSSLVIDDMVVVVRESQLKRKACPSEVRTGKHAQTKVVRLVQGV
ncbi:hypothetical protein IFM89_018420 [Coptis chinensis]|uniref:Homeobox-leucine zipper protein n=1 Tax=Coptis chinensis TaxID=261450 RepID=A0A835H590_9MAGN|nr:hypothetical protein IFM89_018420 [Coptis chinensis]